jgi:hypothetical protein
MKAVENKRTQPQVEGIGFADLVHEREDGHDSECKTLCR